MDSKLSRWCDGFIEAGWLAAVIATPIFFNIHSSRVFEPDKLTLLRSLALLMVVAWIVKFVDQQGWRDLTWLRWQGEGSIWRRPFVLLVALLVLVYLISTVFSVTPRVSLAGSYQRLQGTYTTLSYVVIFALLLATLRRREQVSRIVTAVIVTTIPISLYGMIQHAGLDPLPWGGNVENRIAGHMGNSIFIAAYLIMVLPLTAARIINAFTNILSNEKLSYADVIRSSIYIFTLAVQLIAIYWSGSRGPILGLGVGMFAFVLIFLIGLRNALADQQRFRLADAGRAAIVLIAGILVPAVVIRVLIGVLTSSGRAESLSGPMGSFVSFIAAIGVLMVIIFVMVAIRRGWRYLWLAWIYLALFLAGWLVLFNVPPATAAPYLETPVAGQVLTTLASWRELPAVGRLGGLLESEEGSGRVRVLIWEGALELLRPHEPLQFPNGGQDTFNFLRPLIGYGPESMYVAYNRFYPPELATIEARNASPDRSHNETFDALIITGLLGFLVWQALYLSVFYNGFRWLGVVRSKVDRNLLIGFWVGGAVVGGVVLTLLFDLSFLGVAIPFGSIFGLVIYLIYQALFGRAADGAAQSEPFQSDRLLMVALVAAVLAHYVEIHFGIAIAATRVHFFVYVALMFLVGYLLPRLAETPATAAATVSTTTASKSQPPSKRRRPRTAPASASSSWAGPVWTAAWVMALVVGILGFEYMNYTLVLPPGQTTLTLEDVPTAGQIVHQAFLENVAKEIPDAPYIFLLMIVTWTLGCLLHLCELARQGVLHFGPNSGRGVIFRLRLSAALFGAMALAGIAFRILATQAATGASQALGNVLIWLWSALCLWAALRLLGASNGPEDPSRSRHWLARLFLAGDGRRVGGIVATMGVLYALPVMVGGAGWMGLLLLVICSVVLYLLWDKSWNSILLPAAIIALVSLGVGLFYAYLQAGQIRTAIIGPQGVTDSPERRVLEANLVTGYLSVFYLFVILLLFFKSVALAWPGLGRVQNYGSTAAYTSLAVLFIASLVAINLTNIRVVQADIVYKRGDPWDKKATRSRVSADWDNAIAVYEHAIDLAPHEDFYYLWLGRAYLEQSSVSDVTTQGPLLQRAQDRLLRAQTINPLNTDHTANLARLNTRWAELAKQSGDESSRLAKLEAAVDYYEDALNLSPHNAVIWNEYARLSFALMNDCDKALELYDKSGEVDPYYPRTYFERADVLTSCAAELPAEEQAAYYQQAVTSYEQGLEREPDDPRVWVQLAQLYQRMDNFEKAAETLNEARQYANERVTEWEIDFALASAYLEMGDVERARRAAEQALAAAPPDQAGPIQALLDRINQ